MNSVVPKALGYRFPAEFEPHEATWLSWPHKEASWPGKIQSIYPNYAKFIAAVAAGEMVCINVNDESMAIFAANCLREQGFDPSEIRFYIHPTNDAWCRDHGPAFLVNPDALVKKIIVDWDYNAWGNKYPPFDLDDQVPTLVGKALNIPVYYPGIVMEGGSVDFNGQGTLITSTACLLHPNRNPAMNRTQIESKLRDYYGVDQILWVEEGIVGDDTDGHIDDTVRFFSAEGVLVAVEDNRTDPNYALLKKNLNDLKKMRLINGKQLDIAELPMPDPVYYDGQRLPASYANFYIANQVVVVPTFRCSKDENALDIIARCFPERKVLGIDSTDIIWGLGSFHCLSQQEPKV